MPSFQNRFLEKRFDSVPAHWGKCELGEILWERNESSSDLSKYPLFSLTIADGVTEKTEQYERSFLLKDKDNNEYRLVHPQDVVFNPMNLRFGAIAISKMNNIVSVSAYYNVLSHNKTKCHIPFLYVVLKSYQFMDLYERVAIGSLFEKRRVHLSEFIKLKVFLPPLTEQRRIANVISDWDKGIEVLETLIAAKQKRKKGLMQQLLTGKKRFKKFQAQKWNEYQIHEVVNTIFSNVDKNSHKDETPVFLCNYTDVYKNEYITNKLPFMKATATTNEISKFTLMLDDVIITKDSETPDDIANSAVVIEPLKNVLCGYHLAILRPKPNVITGAFLAQMLMLQNIRHKFTRVANGATRYGLGADDIREISLRIPEIQEQRKIASVLNAADQEIELLQKKLESMKQQKKGLMQKLLTGKIRVKV